MAKAGSRQKAPQAAAAPAGSGFLTTKSADFADPAPMGLPSSQDIKKESNPFTDRDPRMVAYAWVGFLLRILLLFGAVFSILQYAANRSEKRVERTLELVGMWDSNDYQEAQKALRARLSALNKANETLIGSNPSAAELKVYYAAIGQQLMTPEGGTMPLADFEPHFERVVYFLNRVGTCVKSNICDRDVAGDYFMDYAKSFWDYFSEYAADRRKGSPNFAKPIEEYVKSAPPVAPAAE